ncbi:hypothetical protein [Dehalobacter sp. 14DCB1]|uniref:hypothetical protein n=1 Tax=Dehalobacter sp. 14DCB1 TaxID=2070227 RepID=UPI001A9B7CA0|nr:hypothetical protein [Dehalobacter sp. 14DCB1]
MSSRWTTVVTTAGAALLAGISGHIFNFTKAQCGSGTVAVEALASQVAVTGMVKNLSITAVSHTDNIAKLRLQLTNASVETGFDLHQIGIFAKLDTDPTDVLFMIIQADTPDYIPAAAESPNFVNDYVVNVFVGNEATIEGNIDLAAYVTIGMLTDTETVAGAQAKANAAQAAAQTHADQADAAHVAAADPHSQYALDSDLSNLAGAGRTNETVKGNADALTNHLLDNALHVPHLGITTNNGNIYSLTSTKVIGDGAKFSVKFNAAATGTATLNISSDGTARTLKKPDGNDFKPKAGIYSFIRDGVNFQLLGEGGEYGTAGAAQTLTGYSVGTENGLIDGMMPNRAGETAALSSEVSGTTLKLLASDGYRDGVDDKVTIMDADFVAENIKSGVNIFGIDGVLPEVQGTISNYLAAAGETISAGDFVQFTKTLAVGSQNTLLSSYFTIIDAVQLTDTTALLVYRGASNYGTSVIVTIAGSTLTLGTPTVFASTTSASHTLSKLTATCVLVSYCDVSDSYKGKACVLTISGTSVSAGTIQTFCTTDMQNGVDSCGLTSTTAILVYKKTSDGYPRAVIATVTGTNVAFGTEVTVYAASSPNFSVCAISSTKIFVRYYIYGILLTVSGTTITVVYSANIDTLCTGGGDTIALGSDYIIVAYTQSSGSFQFYASIVKVTSNSFTTVRLTLTNIIGYSNYTPKLIKLSSNSALLYYLNDSFYPYIVNFVLDVENSAILLYSIANIWTTGINGSSMGYIPFGNNTLVILYGATNLYSKIVNTNYVKKKLNGTLIEGVAKTGGISGNSIQVYI